VSKLTKPFKPYIVKRSAGGCQVLFPLTELDTIIALVLAAAEGERQEIINLVLGARERSARAVRLSDLEEALGI